MPVNKDAMARYRIIDRMLADPNKDYTTAQIAKAVSLECPKVTIRMIQKDIKALEDDFGKTMVRNAGGRGTVRYEDQTEPLFYQELTTDEEEILREVLRSLGQFEGLDNFAWLELLRKKLSMEEQSNQRPIISFSKNEGLQIPDTLLGRLFSAISRKKVIRFKYRVFNQPSREYTVYPYQLKQYNDRWYLLCNPLADECYPFKPDFIANFALDRMESQFEYVEDEPYIDTPVDLKARFDEIIGVTLNLATETEDIFFAVHPKSVNYVRTKYIHITQIELEGEYADRYKEMYPALNSWSIFSIECRPNYELYSRFASFGDAIVILEPAPLRENMRKLMADALKNYSMIDEGGEHTLR